MSCARGCCPDSKTHYRSIRVGVDSTKVLSNGYTTAQDAVDARDMAAYKELRAQGLQPPRWRGAASLAATATSEVEISHGHTMPAPLVKAFEEAAQT